MFFGSRVYEFSNCIVDLNNSNVYEHVRFVNSVIHYNGGPVAIGTAEFVNCTFVVDIPDVPKTPVNSSVLLALLNSSGHPNLRISFR